MAVNSSLNEQPRKTIYRIAKNSENSFEIPEDVINDKNLSLKAKGLYCFMLSKPKDFRFWDAELEKYSASGISVVKSAIKELKKAGYVRRQPIKNEEGKVVSWETVVYDEKFSVFPNKDIKRNNRSTNKNKPGAYRSWAAAKLRCFYERNSSYKNYGGRGITMCLRWRNDFEAFLKDMGERPEKTSIDRIDNDGHYSCGKCKECKDNNWKMNCRWATAKQQNENRISTVESAKSKVSEIPESETSEFSVNERNQK